MTLHSASLLIVLTAAACSGQTNVEIQLPASVPSESLFARYCVAGESDGYCDWLESKPNVQSYYIGPIDAERPGARVSGLLYAPGCAIETFEFSAAGLKNHPHYSFTCCQLPAISISGELTRTDRLHGRKIAIYAKYVPYWAASFFGIADGVTTSVPVSALVSPTSDNHFRLSVPDFARDRLAGAADHEGSLQIWAVDQVDGGKVALLIPTENVSPGVKAKMGGLRIRDAYPFELVFATCTANPEPVLDQFGFALRPGTIEDCGR